MGRESTAWQWFKAGMEPYGGMTRVENSIEEGTPDVNFVLFREYEGWLELKSLKALPARPTTALFSGQHKVTPPQLEWIAQRVRHGGRVFVVVRAPKYLFIVKGRFAANVNVATLAEMIELACYFHQGVMKLGDWEGCARALCGK